MEAYFNLKYDIYGQNNVEIVVLIVSVNFSFFKLSIFWRFSKEMCHGKESANVRFRFLLNRFTNSFYKTTVFF